MARSETRERLVSQAAALVPTLRASMAAAEQARRLPREVFDELAAADVFRMTAPKRFGGLEADFPPEPYEPVFTLAREEGLASVPHAGEVAGPPSVRGALEELGADRLRHGIRVAEDPGLLRELAGRRIVLDVCPISNLRTRAVVSLEEHPLPQLIEAGALCSISTDDPAMFGTDLGRDYEAATSFGLDPRDFFAAGLEGALCDDETRSRLQLVGDSYDWDALRVREGQVP